MPQDRAQPQGGLAETSVRLEGKLTPVLEALPLYERLERALRGSHWQKALAARRTDLKRAAELDPQVLVGIDALERYVTHEAFGYDSASRRILRKAKALRAEFERRVQFRAPDSKDVASQLLTWAHQLVPAEVEIETLTFGEAELKVARSVLAMAAVIAFIATYSLSGDGLAAIVIGGLLGALAVLAWLAAVANAWLVWRTLIRIRPQTRQLALWRRKGRQEVEIRTLTVPLDATWKLEPSTRLRDGFDDSGRTVVKVNVVELWLITARSRQMLTAIPAGAKVEARFRERFRLAFDPPLPEEPSAEVEAGVL